MPPTIGTSLCAMFSQTTRPPRLPFRINERRNNAGRIHRNRGEKIQYNTLRKSFVSIFISECACRPLRFFCLIAILSFRGGCVRAIVSANWNLFADRSKLAVWFVIPSRKTLIGTEENQAVSNRTVSHCFESLHFQNANWNTAFGRSFGWNREFI